MSVEKDVKRTVAARVVPGFSSDVQPGDCGYRASDKRLCFACPGCGLWGSVRIGSPKPEQQPSWDIVKGSPDDPTTLSLSPSIHCVGCCGWHGYLTDGVFKSC